MKIGIFLVKLERKLFGSDRGGCHSNVGFLESRVPYPNEHPVFPYFLSMCDLLQGVPDWIIRTPSFTIIHHAVILYRYTVEFY